MRSYNEHLFSNDSPGTVRVFGLVAIIGDTQYAACNNNRVYV